MSWIKILTVGHTAISLMAVLTGVVVARGLTQSRGRALWSLAFLGTAALTTLTGFLFPYKGLTPAFILGVLSVPPLALAFLARYRHNMAGAWRGAYVVTTVTTLYFNCIVLIVQSFRNVPFLNRLAPTQTEWPFLAAQLITLALLIGIGVASFRRFWPRMMGEDVIFPKVGYGATRYKTRLPW